MSVTPTKALIDISKLENLADKIRAKTGTSDLMTVDEMATAVENIPSGGLPSEYEAVEYIESTGTQYIDTGVTANQYTGMVVDTEFTSTSGVQVMGYNGYPNNFCFGIADNKFSYIWGNLSDWTRLQNSPDTQRHIWGGSPFGSMGFLDSSTTYISRGNNFTTGNLYLFRMNNATPAFCSCKMYSAIIYDKYALVRDFVPCIRKADDEAGLYDLVNGVFYTNAGTGDFVVPT